MKHALLNFGCLRHYSPHDGSARNDNGTFSVEVWLFHESLTSRRSATLASPRQQKCGKYSRWKRSSRVVGAADRKSPIFFAGLGQ